MTFALQDIDNEPLARLAGGEEVEIVVSHDRIGSVMLLTARSPWLAMVLDSLVLSCSLARCHLLLLSK